MVVTSGDATAGATAATAAGWSTADVIDESRSTHPSSSASGTSSVRVTVCHTAHAACQLGSLLVEREAATIGTDEGEGWTAGG